MMKISTIVLITQNSNFILENTMKMEFSVKVIKTEQPIIGTPKTIEPFTN